MCDCKIGPGKFEAEPALTFLAWEAVLNGWSDTSTGDEESLVEWFRRPFNFDTDETILGAALDYGYCEPCIAAALADESYGLAVWEDSQGFVWSRTFDTEEEFDAALFEAESEGIE